MTTQHVLANPGGVPTTKRSRYASMSRSKVALVLLSKYGTLLAMALMLLIFGFAVPNGAFFNSDNLINIINQSSLTAIIASGLTIVLVVGEFDLSIGYVASLAGVLVTGLVAKQGLPLVLSIIVTLLIGTGIGTVNGLVVTKARVNAVVATLGVGTVVVGMSYGYTAGSPIVQVPDSFFQLTLGKTLGLPNPIWLMIIILFLLWVILNRTPLGQRIQAVGGNLHAARLAGIRTDRVKITTFAIAGLCAAITGVLLSSLLGSGTAAAADSYLMDSFAAVFLGSATLRDGEFHIVGTLIGVLIVNVGFNGLSQLGTPVFWQYVFKGGILVIAVALSTVARRYAKT
ncbi:MAG TPA: ABC transporter permease [Candidatus Nanopelagicaceae bacterium]